MNKYYYSIKYIKNTHTQSHMYVYDVYYINSYNHGVLSEIWLFVYLKGSHLLHPTEYKNLFKMNWLIVESKNILNVRKVPG